MTTITKTIGRLPQYVGDWEQRTSPNGYKRRNRVTMFGSEFESLVDNNTQVPATYNSSTGVITVNTTYWKVISNALGAYVIDQQWPAKEQEMEDFKTSVNTSIAGKLDASEKAAANGVASLDSNTKVPIAQLPTGANGLATLDNASKVPSSQIPTASSNTLGGVKVGTNLSIDNNGVLSATDTTYSTMGASGSSHAGGLVPDTPSTAGTTKFLREDGTWQEPESGGSSLSDVSYDTTNKKLQKTLSDTPTDIVTAHDLMVDGNADLLDGYTVIDTWGTDAEHYDLDDLTTPGVYVMTDSTKKDYFDNKAYDDIFVLKVSTNAEGNVVQRFIRPNSTAYQRRFTNGAFNSWYLIEKALPANMESASYTDHVVISEDWHGKTTSSSRPSSVGWYRIGEVDDVFDVIVYQKYSNSSGTSFRIFGAITNGSGSSATYRIAQIGGAGNDNIDRVRVTFESNSYYFEFRYASTVANHIFWKFLQGTPFEDIQAGGGTEVQNIYLDTVGPGSMLTTDTSSGKLTKRLVLRENYKTASGALTIDAGNLNIYRCGLTGNISGVTINNMASGQQLFVIFYTSSARTVTIAHNSTYKCAKGEDVSLSIPAGGNRVVCFTNNYDEIYVSVFANV